MRNAMKIDGDLIVTTDNSGGIGEKPQDLVAVSDSLTAYYSARVALLEQWAAHANPLLTIIHNFSGTTSWDPYVRGVTELLVEAGVDELEISGSTETNMALLQSAVAVTMVGKCERQNENLEGEWFVYGSPLVGDEVVQHPEEVASMRKMKEALDAGTITRLWPIGSKGLLYEIRKVLADEQVQIEATMDLYKSAGPSTAVLVQIPALKIEEVQKALGKTLRKITYL